MLVRIVPVLIIFAAGLFSGLLADSWWSDLSHRDENIFGGGSSQVRESSGYRFINPLLECEVSSNSIETTKESFKDDLESEVTALKGTYELSDAAVYFRDMNNGPTFGVGEEEEFFPASLLKVPIMMAFFSISESDPSILKKTLTFSSPKDLGVFQSIPSTRELALKESYTVEELIRRMIVYSDNQASYLLLEHLPKEKMAELFRMLGVGDDVLSAERSALTVKEYASFFRILFNSSYLSRENSEKALALLSESEYRDALLAGVPDGISVAHKFGEAGTGSDIRQLHDCGIVYFPGHPYLLCIMTRGHDIRSLQSAIADISRFVYGKVDEQY